MNKIRVCFRVRGLARDKDDNPCDAGLQVSLGETDKNIDYSALTSNINIEAILKMVCLDSIVSTEDVTIITPEEYDREFGDDAS